ncbi:MAG: hypothetical protein ACPGMR_14800 [Pontibacterium sp.]
MRSLLMVICLCLPWASAHTMELPADPTRPTNHVKKEQATVKRVVKSYTVNYIKQSPAGSTAMVNGVVVKPGQWVQGAYVKAITGDQVVLRVSGRTRVLSLGSSAGFKKQIKE